MFIKKNGKTYSVKENKQSWTVSIVNDRVTVSVNVPKEDCPTFDSLQKYVIENDLF